MKLLSLALLMVSYLPGSFSADLPTSVSLQTKDYEEMREILSEYVKNSQKHAKKEDSAISELEKGLKILLMRPDSDSMQASLIIILRNEIIKYQSFMSVFEDLVENTIKDFQSQSGSIAYQASLLYILENSLSYLQSINNKESTNILEKIKTAKLKINKKVSNYLGLEMGRGQTASPSYLAKQILRKRAQAEKKELALKAEREKRERKKEKEKEIQEAKNQTETKKNRDPASAEPEDKPRRIIKIEI